MSLIFPLCCVIMIFIDYKITHRWINITTTLSIPYALIIPVNNIFMLRYDFYGIDDNVIRMLLIGIFCVFVGSNVAHYLFSYSNPTAGLHANIDVTEKINYIKWKPMIRYATIVIIVSGIRLCYFFVTKGLYYIGSEDFSGIMASGILGHFLLSSTPLIPVMFYYWLVNKKEKKYLFVVLLLIFLFFTTFIKYHVIGIIIATYLMASFEEKKYVKPGAIILGIGAASAFVLNYLVSFFLRGVIGNIRSSYYFQHLWGYISGSLIYDNYIFDKGVRVGTSIFYKIGTFLCAPVNLFLNALFGMRLFPHEKQPHLLIGSNGERGNVVDAIGYLFPSKGSTADILLFCLTMILIGFAFSMLYDFGTYRSRLKNIFSILLAYFMTYFVTLSFFGTFYINSVPYEVLFWCWVMMLVFDKRTKIYFGSKKVI